MGHSLWEGDRHAAGGTRSGGGVNGASLPPLAAPCTDRRPTRLPSTFYIQSRAPACGANETHLSASPAGDQVPHAVSRGSALALGGRPEVAGLARRRRHNTAAKPDRPASVLS